MNRGLTREEAERGVIPLPLTKGEWQAMHEASRKASVEAISRTVRQMLRGAHDPR